MNGDLIGAGEDPTGPENVFVGGIRPRRIVINCLVITHLSLTLMCTH